MNWIGFRRSLYHMIGSDGQEDVAKRLMDMIKSHNESHPDQASGLLKQIQEL